jgi:kumamolisin
MSKAARRRTVPGSEKKALPGGKVIGKADPDQRIEVTVLLRPRKGKAGDLAMEESARRPGRRRYLGREEFAAVRGADPEDVAKVEAFAGEHRLTVVEVSLPRRSLVLAGTVDDLTTAFWIDLMRARVGGRMVRTRRGGIMVPSGLKDIVVGVFGLDDRPAAKPHLRFRAEQAALAGRRGKPSSRTVTERAFKPPEVARLYGFPAGLTGAGQCIAIVELNDVDERGAATGSGFSAGDLKAYFKSLGLPAPKVTAVGVDGGANRPGPDGNADGEVMLDIEIAGAVAPGARIAVYFAPNTDRGFLDAVGAALHDTVRKPGVISISWGSPEDANTAQARSAFDGLLRDAAALGVTVCCAAGDDGSSDIHSPGDRDGRPHVDFPSASPFALSCGGTRLLGTGAAISGETVWKSPNAATGGGVSDFFPRPAYQAAAGVPRSPRRKVGRGVPDVSGNADPSTGYVVRLVGGRVSVIGGTSAVAPLWAGLVARVNQGLAKRGKPAAGFLNPILYGLPPKAGAFRDVLEGDNDLEGLGKYAARPGWDPCTGLGTPDGARLLAALGGGKETG